MRVIENKTTAITKTADANARYSDLIAALLTKPLTAMISLKDMRRDLRLIDLLEQAEDTIELQDEDFNFIAKLVESSEWAIKHRDILDFADYIDSLATMVA